MSIYTKSPTLTEVCMSEPVYRHEIKYETDSDKASLIRHNIAPVLAEDSNVGPDGSYIVKSLYFETPYSTDYHDKELGVQFRQKMRLRTYAGSDVYKLEIKSKNGDVATKYAVSLTKQQAESLVNGDYTCLVEKATANRLYIYHQLVTNVYRPLMTVTYKRYPFVNQAGNLRLTFDEDIRYSVSPQAIFEDIPRTGIVTDKTIIEIKYDDFVPQWITDYILQSGINAGESSKYAAAFRNIFD